MKIRDLLLFFVLLIIIPINVKAGICDGQAKDSLGFCKISPISVGRGYITKNMYYTNGEAMTVQKYSINYNGAQNDVFCLDAVESSPYSFNYARELDIENSSFDRGIAAIYQLYFEGYMYAKRHGQSLDNWLDYANVAMRSLLYRYKYGNYRSSYPTNYGSSNLFAGWLENSALVFEGQQLSKNKIRVDTNHPYIVAKLYYCRALMAADEIGKRTNIIPSSSYAYCEKYVKSGYSADNHEETNNYGKTTVKAYKVKFNADKEKAVTQFDEAGNFTQTVDVSISNWEEIYSGYNSIKGVLNSYLNISGVSCSDSRLSCSLAENSNIGINLFEKYDENISPTIKIKIKGKLADFKRSTNIKASINYNYYMPLSTDNLVIMKQDETTQRMVAYLTDSSISTKFDLTLSMPSVCQAKVETNDGVEVQKYYIGTQTEENNVKDALVYMQDYGCCNVNSSLLDEGSEALKYYEENCQVDDEVKLVQNCGSKCDENTKIEDTKYSESYIKQVSIDKIMKQIAFAEGQYNKGYYSLDTLLNEYKKYTKWTDSDYVTKAQDVKSHKIASDGTETSTDTTETDDTASTDTTNNIVLPASGGNTYCTLYTSETDNIFYPTTTVATSGQFFVFKKDTQPYIKGTIIGNMHTDYNRWESDFDDAVSAEKDAYTMWQTDLNYNDALGNAKAIMTGSECCEKSADGKTCAKSATYTNYSGTATGKYYYAGNSYGAQNLQSPYNVKYTIGGCDGGGAPSPKDTDADKKSLDAAKNTRIQLQTYKADCQNRTDLDTYWNYNLDPDLTFHYKQNVLSQDGKNTVSNNITDDVKMSISTNKVKYWLGESTDVNKSSETGSENFKSKPITYGFTGGQNIYNYKADKTTDYSITYNQTLYYKPNTVYYSLIPDGKIITSKSDSTSIGNIAKTYSNGQLLEIGYVYNLSITNYMGSYETWFSLNNVGHLFSNYNKSSNVTTKPASNTQQSLTNYLNANPEYKDSDSSSYASKCCYYDQEVIIKRNCATCTDPNAKPQFIYRSVSTTDINPNNRTLGTNWSDAKGDSALKQIEALGGNAISNAIDDTYKNLNSVIGSNNKVALLNKTDTKTKTELLATKVDTYDDDHLEYEFVLTSAKMKYIKQYNVGKNYADMDFSNNVSFGNNCEQMTGYSCNSSGKECISGFVTCYASNTSGRNKWKYYNNETKSFANANNSSTLFYKAGEFGAYPEPEDNEGNKYLDTHTNWP